VKNRSAQMRRKERTVTERIVRIVSRGDAESAEKGKDCGKPDE
jgi:hypothetical protein